MSKERSQKTSQRFDKGKWWFSPADKEQKMLFVERINGRVESKSAQLREVRRIEPSKSKQHLLKILFRGKKDPLVFDIGLFDFTANAISKKFEPFLKSKDTFCDEVNSFINPAMEPMSPTIIEDDISMGIELAETALISKPSPAHDESEDRQTRPSKRPAPTSKPEVDPLPLAVKRQKQLDSTGENQQADKAFLEIVKKEYLIREDPFVVKISSLVQPRNEFLIRPLDNVFVTKLKSEILERCSTFVKPLIAVVNNITDKANFDEKKLHEYVLEVIGGNHRREAYTQLEKEKQLEESQLTIKVHLFTEMSQQHALRLAQLHNREDAIHHDLTTQDKIALCRKLFKKNANTKDSQWRKACSSIIGQSEIVLSNVLYVAAELEDDAYDLLMEMLELYGQMKLKGQRASKKILKEGTSTLTSKLCLPYSKLRCLRGELTNQEIVEMLTTVVHLEMSVTDLEKELCRIKEMRALQNYFVKATDSSSWEHAKERYPNATTEEALQGYRGDVFRGKAKDRFKSFVQRAVGSTTSASLQCTTVLLLEVDLLEDLDHGFIQQNAPEFNGADLVFLDIPKGWKVEALIRFVRLIKSLNLAKNVEETKLVFFPSHSSETMLLEQLNIGLKALKSM